MSDNRPLPRLTLRSADLTPARAFEVWRQTLPQYRIDLPDTPIADFWMDVSAWMMDPLLVTSGRTAAARLERPADRLGDGYNNIVFIQFQVGRFRGEADGRPFDYGEGEICVMDTSRPFWGHTTDGQYVLVNVSREVIGRLLPSLPDLHGHVLRWASGRILAEHFAALVRFLPEMGRDEALRMGRATLTLMAASLGEVFEGAMGAPAVTASAIRLRVERYVENHLASPGLSPETISQALEIPRSTLYRAFSGLGGVSNYVQMRRLDASRALLFHPEEHRSIGEIAEALGFESQASFSKAFRRRFGSAPREARLRGTTRIASSRALFDSWQDVLSAAHPPAVGRIDPAS